MGLFRTLRRRVATRGGDVDESAALVTGQERTSSDVEEGDPQRPLCVSPARGPSSSAAGTPRSHEAYVSPTGDPAPPLPVTKSRSLDIHDKGHRRKLRFRRRGGSAKREVGRDDRNDNNGEDEEEDLGDIEKMTTFDGAEVVGESRSGRQVRHSRRSLVEERDMGPIDLDEVDSDSSTQGNDVEETETRTEPPPSSPSSVSPDDEAGDDFKEDSPDSKPTDATKRMSSMEDGGSSTSSTRTNSSQSSNSSFSSASSSSSSGSSPPSQHVTTRKPLSMQTQFIPQEQQRLRLGDEETSSLQPLSKPPLAPSRSSDSLDLALHRRRAASMMTRPRPTPLVGRDDDNDDEEQDMDERHEEEEKEEPQEDNDSNDDEEGAHLPRAAVRTGRDHRRVSSDGSGQYLHIPLGDQLSTLYEEMQSEHEDSGDDADDEGRGGGRRARGLGGAARRALESGGDSSSSQGSLSREDLFESEIGRYQVGRMTAPSIASTARSQGGTGRLIVAASAADDAVNIRQRWDYALRVMKRMGQCQPADVSAAVLMADDGSTTSDEEEEDAVRKVAKGLRSPRQRQKVEIGEI